MFDEIYEMVERHARVMDNATMRSMDNAILFGTPVNLPTDFTEYKALQHEEIASIFKSVEEEVEGFDFNKEYEESKQRVLARREAARIAHEEQVELKMAELEATTNKTYVDWEEEGTWVEIPGFGEVMISLDYFSEYADDGVKGIIVRTKKTD